MVKSKLVLCAGAVLSAAIAAHEVNRAYCRFLGDDSQPAWPDAPEWQTASAMAGVAFHVENPDAGPEASHNSWLKQKETDGWVFGEAKDPDKKTHPCMVPFDQLPREQQLKDVLFQAVVHAVYFRAAGSGQGEGEPDRDEPELTVDELLERFRAGHGSKGSAEIVARLDAAEGALETANEEIAGLRAQVEASAREAEKAKNAAKVAKGDKPAKVRKFPGQDIADRPATVELVDAVWAAERTEVVFLSRGKEIAGLAPLVVQGDAWRVVPQGLMLTEAVELEGPVGGCTVDGFGLVLDGKPVLGRGRIGGPIMLGAGSRVKLTGDIIL